MGDRDASSDIKPAPDGGHQMWGVVCRAIAIAIAMLRSVCVCVGVSSEMRCVCVTCVHVLGYRGTHAMG